MSGICPSCAGSDLKPVRLEAELAAQGCVLCGGVFLMLADWRHWRERNGQVVRAGIAAASAAPASSAHAISDTRNLLRCPGCAGFMTKYRFAADSGNQIDFCANCDAVWLDRGEWQLLERFALTAELSRVFSRPFQSRVRSSEARNRQETRYREQFGADYERLREWREWLAKQPQGREMLAYLYLSQTDSPR